MHGIIYSALNITNGKRYVGQTIQRLHNRRLAHLRKTHHSVKFSLALQKYRGQFLWTILDVANDQSELDTKEQFWIQHYCSHIDEYGYNLQRGGQSGKHSDESKRKIGDANRGRIASPETRERISKSKKGRSHFSKLNTSRRGTTLSDEHRKKCSDSLKGRKFSDEHKMKLSETNGMTYAVISPTNERTVIHGLSKWCRQNGFSQSGFSSVLTGKQKDYKGWKIEKQ